MGLLSFKDKDYRASVAYLSTGLELQPGSEMFLRKLAIAYSFLLVAPGVQRREYRTGVKIMKAAVERFPKEAHHSLNLAVVLAKFDAFQISCLQRSRMIAIF